MRLSFAHLNLYFSAFITICVKLLQAETVHGVSEFSYFIYVYSYRTASSVDWKTAGKAGSTTKLKNSQ